MAISKIYMRRTAFTPKSRKQFAVITFVILLIACAGCAMKKFMMQAEDITISSPPTLNPKP